MRGAELQRACTQLRAAGNGRITAATLRQSLVTNEVKYAARLEGRDQAIQLEMRHAVGRPLSELTFQSHGHYLAADYESGVRQAWETLQDVADSKFPRSSQKGRFPALATLPRSPKVFVTDTWQVDGIRVEIGILAASLYGEPALTYAAVLKVTNIAAQPKVQ
jgi:hypothetical protein